MSKYRFWTDEETTYLKANYRDLGAAACAAYCKRTVQEVYEKAHNLKITKTHFHERGPRMPMAKPERIEPKSPSVKPSEFIAPIPRAKLMSGRG